MTKLVASLVSVALTSCVLGVASAMTNWQLGMTVFGLTLSLAFAALILLLVGLIIKVAWYD